MEKKNVNSNINLEENKENILEKNISNEKNIDNTLSNSKITKDIEDNINIINEKKNQGIIDEESKFISENEKFQKNIEKDEIIKTISIDGNENNIDNNNIGIDKEINEKEENIINEQKLNIKKEDIKNNKKNIIENKINEKNKDKLNLINDKYRDNEKESQNKKP